MSSYNDTSSLTERLDMLRRHTQRNTIEAIGMCDTRWLIIKMRYDVLRVETYVDPTSFAPAQRVSRTSMRKIYSHARQLMKQGYIVYVKDADGAVYVQSDSEKQDTLISLSLPSDLQAQGEYVGAIYIEGSSLEKLGYLDYLNEIRTQSNL